MDHAGSISARSATPHLRSRGLQRVTLEGLAIMLGARSLRPISSPAVDVAVASSSISVRLEDEARSPQPWRSSDASTAEDRRTRRCDTEVDDSRIVKVKRFAMKPMPPDRGALADGAARPLVLLLLRTPRPARPPVVYRRADGDVGLIGRPDAARAAATAQRCACTAVASASVSSPNGRSPAGTRRPRATDTRMPATRRPKNASSPRPVIGSEPFGQRLCVLEELRERCSRRPTAAERCALRSSRPTPRRSTAVTRPSTRCRCAGRAGSGRLLSGARLAAGPTAHPQRARPTSSAVSNEHGSIGVARHRVDRHVRRVVAAAPALSLRPARSSSCRAGVRLRRARRARDCRRRYTRGKAVAALAAERANHRLRHGSDPIAGSLRRDVTHASIWASRECGGSGCSPARRPEREDYGLHAAADSRSSSADASCVGAARPASRRAEEAGALPAIVDRLRLSPSRGSRAGARGCGSRRSARSGGRDRRRIGASNGLRVRQGTGAARRRRSYARTGRTSRATRRGSAPKSGNAAFLRGVIGAISSNIARRGRCDDGFVKAGLPDRQRHPRRRHRLMRLRSSSCAFARRHRLPHPRGGPVAHRERAGACDRAVRDRRRRQHAMSTSTPLRTSRGRRDRRQREGAAAVACATQPSRCSVHRAMRSGRLRSWRQPSGGSKTSSSSATTSSP